MCVCECLLYPTLYRYALPLLQKILNAKKGVSPALADILTSLFFSTLFLPFPLPPLPPPPPSPSPPFTLPPPKQGSAEAAVRVLVLVPSKELCSQATANIKVCGLLTVPCVLLPIHPSLSPSVPLSTHPPLCTLCQYLVSLFQELSMCCSREVRILDVCNSSTVQSIR